MGGFFGVTAKGNCTGDIFYGTDYHSHLGTQRGGLATLHDDGIDRYIHDITNSQFRSKFDEDIGRMHGASGVGVISDFEDQPLLIHSHLGLYAIVTVGRVTNLEALVDEEFGRGNTHFSEMSGDGINPTELIATLINQKSTFAEGIRFAQQKIEGSCSLLLLTREGLYAARDLRGRTPVILGTRKDARAATIESCALYNLAYEYERDLGPGEIVCLTPEGCEVKAKPADKLHICSFMWVYYGYPASSYEGINVEDARNRCGAALAAKDRVEVDLVAGIPDSGIAHALGYANESKCPYRRPFVKYTPTWPRSFMPQNQAIRDMVARMKLIPIRELVEGQRLLFCEDSIVRGTQLGDTIRRMYAYGAKEVHMRSACPPLVYDCPYLNFSRSGSVMNLAARRAIRELGEDPVNPAAEFTRHGSEPYERMVNQIGKRLGLTSLRYQHLDDMVKAIGLPREQLCTFCLNGADDDECRQHVDAGV